MTDPIRKDAGLSLEHRHGVVVSVKVSGGADAVLALPETLTTEDAVAQWLLQLGYRMASGDTLNLTIEEVSFATQLFQIASNIVQADGGLQWKILNILSPDELNKGLEEYKKGIQ